MVGSVVVGRRAEGTVAARHNGTDAAARQA
jgi:hypothetical protein